MNGWMDEWIDGWINERMGRWIVELVDKRLNVGWNKKIIMQLLIIIFSNNLHGQQNIVHSTTYSHHSHFNVIC